MLTARAEKFRLAWGITMSLMFSMQAVHAAVLSEAEKGLLSFYGKARIIDAIRVDIDRFSIYGKGNRGYWEERISQDLRELKSARQAVQGADFPEEIESLRTAFLAAGDALEAYSKAFLQRDAKSTDIAEDLLIRKCERLNDKLEQISVELLIPPVLEDRFDPLDAEYAAFSDEEGRDAFLKAAYQLEERRFDVALKELTQLQDKYRGTSAEGCIVLRMVRCVLKDHGVNVPAEVEKAQIRALERLMDSRIYYPNYYEIFLEWRMLYQGFNYGVNAESEIPNLLYLARLRAVLQVLEDQVETDPKDNWARIQLWMLAQLPVITRSGLDPAEGASRVPVGNGASVGK